MQVSFEKTYSGNSLFRESVDIQCHIPADCGILPYVSIEGKERSYFFDFQHYMGAGDIPSTCVVEVRDVLAGGVEDRLREILSELISEQGKLSADYSEDDKTITFYLNFGGYSSQTKPIPVSEIPGSLKEGE